MGGFKEVKGDLIALLKQGKFQIGAQNVNCFCVQKAGLAPQMVKVFGTDNILKFPYEKASLKGNINKLGCIDHCDIYIDNKDYIGFITIINCYTQYDTRNENNLIPLDYEALTLCMRKINKEFPNMSIGLPLIGCGLAGGDWNRVKQIIQSELKDMDVTIVHYNK